MLKQLRNGSSKQEVVSTKVVKTIDREKAWYTIAHWFGGGCGKSSPHKLSMRCAFMIGELFGDLPFADGVGGTRLRSGLAPAYTGGARLAPKGAPRRPYWTKVQ